ncbi:MAG: hypothetical protein EOP04_12570 [Proteobacteria bacterium]|nr:MAG: hypothetical protein EOP04_12570 [Pseudomonadota bacterium]
MKLFVGLVLFCLVVIGCSTPKKSYIESVSKPIVDSFFTEVRNGQSLSVKRLLSRNAYIDVNDSTTNELIKQFDQIPNSFGPLLDYQLIRTRTIGSDLILYSYLAKYQTKFYRFNFVFYNNSKAVAIYRFSYDDNLVLELEESMKFGSR